MLGKRNNCESAKANNAGFPCIEIKKATSSLMGPAASDDNDFDSVSPYQPVQLTSKAASSRLTHIRSRIGRRYQAVIPELICKQEKGGNKKALTLDSERENRPAKLKFSAQKSKSKEFVSRLFVLIFDIENTVLDPEMLSEYLTFAVTLRECSIGINESKQDVEALALDVLHRWDYDVLDAACALYSRHSLSENEAYGERNRVTSAVPTSCTGEEKDIQADPLVDNMLMTGSTSSGRLEIDTICPETSQVPLEKTCSEWLDDFYTCLSQHRVTLEVVDQLEDLERRGDHLKRAKKAHPVEFLEYNVVRQMLERIRIWRKKYATIEHTRVSRGEVQKLLYRAEDLALSIPSKNILTERLYRFDEALTDLMRSLDHGNGRNHFKVTLDTLKEKLEKLQDTKIIFNQEKGIEAIVVEAQALKTSLNEMCSDEKVSLPAMREVLAKVELVPVDFASDIDRLQHKILNAQSWLTKVRKLIPGRRLTRKRGSEQGVEMANDQRKMELEEIRALVDDNPCGESSEVFEMQDLLDCANAWADRVRLTLEKNPSDVSLIELQDLMEEASLMPVEMEETQYITAEMEARMWSDKANVMLQNMKSLDKVEALLDEVEKIRAKMTVKRRSRWKPQSERDLQTAVNIAKRWVNESKDILGVTYFDKVFTVKSAVAVGEILSQLGVGELRPSNKKTSLSTVLSLIDKASRVPIDLSFYVSRLEKVIEFGKGVQLEIRKVMESIAIMGMVANEQHSDSPVERFDLTTATSLLETAEALPFTFDEAIELGNAVRKEKDWSDRVHAALPFRQSRKVRQRPVQLTKKDLKALLEESKHMYFNFHSEAQMLQKEIEEIEYWQSRARLVLDQSIEENFIILKRLEAFDRKAGEDFQEKREKRQQQERDRIHAAKQKSLTHQAMKMETEDPVCKADIKPNVTCNSTVHVSTPSPHPTMLIQREAIIRQILKESGSSHRWPSSAVEAEAANHGTSKISVGPDTVKDECDKPNEIHKKIPVKRHKPPGRLQNSSILKPFLDMVEEDIEAITKLEANSKFDTSMDTRANNDYSNKASSSKSTADSEARESDVEGSETATKASESSMEQTVMEKAVKSLSVWSNKLTTTLKEGGALNASTPERHLLSLIVETLDWLERSRGFFHESQVPVLKLVQQGEHLQEAIVELQGRSQSHRQPSCSSSLDLLSFCLWPLPFLQCEADIVNGWTRKVESFVEEKSCGIQEAEEIVQEGKLVSQIEPESFKLFSEEMKKIKSWLLKLKKRLKSYITKQIDRLSLPVAQQLVVDGMETIFALPTIIFLKEQVNAAQDWEKRLLESRIETGQAQVDYLSRLLSEYDSSRWVIDLDMHRNVLQTATERYCICRQPYSGFMIGCDHCEDWFHDTCIGLSKERAEKIDHYTCPSCTILLELVQSLNQFKTMTSHMVLNGDTDMFRIQDEKQYKAALRKLRREEKAAERCDLSLQTCLAQIAQVQTKLDQMSKEAYHSHCVSSESPAIVSVQPTCMIKSAHYAPPSISTPGASFPCKVATASNSTDHRKQHFVMPERIGDTRMQKDHEKSLVPHSTGGMPAMNITSSSCMPNILLNSASDRALQPQTKILPAATPSHHVQTSSQLLGRDSIKTAATSGAISHLLPHFMPSVESYTLSHTNPNPGINGLLSGIGPNESLDQRNLSLNLELTKLKAQYAELSEQLHTSRDRVRHAETTLKDLAQRQKTRQECAPIAYQWIHNVIVLVLNQVEFLSASIVKRVPCSESADALSYSFIPTAYQQAIQTAKQQNIHEFPQIETIIRLLFEIGWSFVMVCLLQKRPHRNAIVHALRFAVHHKLYGSHKTCSLYAQLRTLVLRSDLWITKVHKCIEKFNPITAQKQGRLRQAINEYTKLPLTYAQLHEDLITFSKLAEDAFDGMNSDLSLLQHAIEDRMKAMPTLGMLGCNSSGGSTPSKQPTSSRKRCNGSSASPRPKQKRKPGPSGIDPNEVSQLAPSTLSPKFGHQVINSQNASKAEVAKQ
ncbi:unnamed protein product [Albugo candida]|uniref:PHD-type domain-containing protein n=1 Tax=Albugo candida TaxID=65357 RepID=A0A024G3U2_9STRA|nr:unnamed protein product [Albugo candida]|eukprot:CCI40974.1 unnamed protein product [Albugo candida]